MKFKEKYFNDYNYYKSAKTVKWVKFFMGLAEYMASASKDPSTQVGSVIVNDKNQVLGMGYNGFPRGVCDHKERYDDRPTKYSMVVHAEPNAILNSVKSVKGATLFVWPLPPCNECAKLIIQAGIKNVVFFYKTEDPSIMEEGQVIWADRHKISKQMFDEAGVDVFGFDGENLRRI